MISIPEKLLRQPHFSRYYNIWSRDERSILFVPLAEICRTQGYLKEGEAICEKGLQQNPQSVSGRLTLARIFLDQRLKEKAIHLVEKILADFPGHQESLDLLSQVDPKRRPEVSPWETPTMAKVLADQGETGQALEIIHKILIFDPSNRRALQLKESLCRPKS